LVGSLSITENVLGISNAGVDIIEVFSVESTLEDTFNDLGKLNSIKFNLLLSFVEVFQFFFDPFLGILKWVLVVGGPLVHGLGVSIV
jgi:hypothetical protein